MRAPWWLVLGGATAMLLAGCGEAASSSLTVSNVRLVELGLLDAVVAWDSNVAVASRYRFGGEIYQGLESRVRHKVRVHFARPDGSGPLGEGYPEQHVIEILDDDGVTRGQLELTTRSWYGGYPVHQGALDGCTDQTGIEGGFNILRCGSGDTVRHLIVDPVGMPFVPLGINWLENTAVLNHDRYDPQLYGVADKVPSWDRIWAVSTAADIFQQMGSSVVGKDGWTGANGLIRSVATLDGWPSPADPLDPASFGYAVDDWAALQLPSYLDLSLTPIPVPDVGSSPGCADVNNWSNKQCQDPSACTLYTPDVFSPWFRSRALERLQQRLAPVLAAEQATGKRLLLGAIAYNEPAWAIPDLSSPYDLEHGAVGVGQSWIPSMLRQTRAAVGCDTYLAPAIGELIELLKGSGCQGNPYDDAGKPSAAFNTVYAASYSADATCPKNGFSGWDQLYDYGYRCLYAHLDAIFNDNQSSKTPYAYAGAEACMLGDLQAYQQRVIRAALGTAHELVLEALGQQGAKVRLPFLFAGIGDQARDPQAFYDAMASYPANSESFATDFVATHQYARSYAELAGPLSSLRKLTKDKPILHTEFASIAYSRGDETYPTACVEVLDPNDSSGAYTVEADRCRGLGYADRLANVLADGGVGVLWHMLYDNDLLPTSQSSPASCSQCAERRTNFGVRSLGVGLDGCSKQGGAASCAFDLEANDSYYGGLRDWMGFANARLPLLFYAAEPNATATSLLAMLEDDGAPPLIEQLRINHPEPGVVSWRTDEPALCRLGDAVEPIGLRQHFASVAGHEGVIEIICADAEAEGEPLQSRACFTSEGPVSCPDGAGS